MAFDKRSYQREYMANRRAARPTSRISRAADALTQIVAELGDNNKPLAVKLRAIALHGLAQITSEEKTNDH